MGSEGDVPAFLVGSGVGTPLGTPRSLSNQPYHGTMRFCGGAPTSSLPLLPRPRGARVVAAGRTPQTQTINGGSPSGFSSIRLFLTRTAWNTGQVPLHLPPRYVPLYEYRRAGGHAAPPVDAPCAFLHFFNFMPSVSGTAPPGRGIPPHHQPRCCARQCAGRRPAPSEGGVDGLHEPMAARPRLLDFQQREVASLATVRYHSGVTGGRREGGGRGAG